MSRTVSACACLDCLSLATVSLSRMDLLMVFVAHVEHPELLHLGLGGVAVLVGVGVGDVLEVARVGLHYHRAPLRVLLHPALGHLSLTRHHLLRPSPQLHLARSLGRDGHGLRRGVLLARRAAEVDGRLLK